MSTKQLLINTNEDSDLPYKGELRVSRVNFAVCVTPATSVWYK